MKNANRLLGILSKNRKKIKKLLDLLSLSKKNKIVDTGVKLLQNIKQNWLQRKRQRKNVRLKRKQKLLKKHVRKKKQEQPDEQQDLKKIRKGRMVNKKIVLHLKKLIQRLYKDQMSKVHRQNQKHKRRLLKNLSL